ncbi:MAG: hypothetical protein JWO09_895 [Bacteroidetes bacterium]|nr:hypothetical protein [Bacteroidota bacterium]
MRRIFIYFLFTFFSAQLSAQPKIIHVFVALCDNESQGIVPVPKKIGNGNDPDNNLYWGCGYGVRTFFKAAAEWRMVSKRKSVSSDILERCIFKHITKDVYMVADAYKGDHIKKCNEDFFRSSSGNSTDTVMLKEQVLNLQTAQLVCYVGHDGLMDFSIDNYPVQKDNAKKDVMILACASKLYYKNGIKAAGATPVLWTTNLMCPEAYTLKAAIDGWLLNESGAQIHLRAAEAYDQYLKCGIKGAKNLFATGW